MILLGHVLYAFLADDVQQKQFTRQFVIVEKIIYYTKFANISFEKILKIVQFAKKYEFVDIILAICFEFTLIFVYAYVLFLSKRL